MRIATAALSSAIAMLAAVSSAQASLIRISFEGQNSSAASANNNSLGAALSAVSGYVIYDTETPATPFVSNASREAINYVGGVKEFGFTAGGVTGVRSGDFGSIQVSDQFTTGLDRLSFNNMILTPSQIDGEFGGINNVQFTLGLSGPFSALSSAALPGAFDPAIFTGQTNLSVFVSLLDPASQPGVVKSLNFNFTSVKVEEISDVPLPGAFGLFLLGGGVLAAARKKKARL
ncbi:MAG: hypothetical protein R3C58_13765 [Parvularculaceae bacterium]